MESIITALITGGLTLIGTVMTVSSGQKKTDHKLEMAQAVTDCKLDELTREVRMHNNFAQRVPVIEEQVKVINHRIADLEEGKSTFLRSLNQLEKITSRSEEHTYGTGGDCRNRSGGSNGTGGLEVCSVSVRIGWRAVHVNVDHRHPRSRKRGIEYERC